METRWIECRRIIDAFLSRWPINKVQSMQLHDYVDIGNDDTFCYWVERRTISVGSIKGYPSIKFGIYRRGQQEDIPANYLSDHIYSWAPHLKTQNRTVAFDKVKAKLLTIINAAQNGRLELLDEIHFNHLMKWKVASLYASEAVVPIFKKEALWKIAEEKGLSGAKTQPFSVINKHLLKRKPAHLNIYQYALALLNTYWHSEEPSYFILGSKYAGSNEYDMLPAMLGGNVVCTGFAWQHDLSYLYGNLEPPIVAELKKLGEPAKSYNTLKYFLQLRPGDLIAIKSSGQPKAGQAFLQIVAYALVVERSGVVYHHDDNFGHCLHVEFLATDLSKTFALGGYSRTIHQLSDQDVIDVIFSDFRSEQQLQKALYARRKKRRRSMQKKNTAPQQRKGSQPYVARMIHNQIQEKFIDHLTELYGADNIVREEDFVDVKLIQPSRLTLYEIKPFALAEDCVRASLGQLLAYLHAEPDERPKVIRVVGPNRATKEESDFIQFIRKQLIVDFDYEPFSLEDE